MFDYLLSVIECILDQWTTEAAPEKGERERERLPSEGQRTLDVSKPLELRKTLYLYQPGPT